MRLLIPTSLNRAWITFIRGKNSRATRTTQPQLIISFALYSEFILTLGHSLTVESFLRAAHRKRHFTVIVAETAPSFSGRSLAASLSASGIPTILIPDSNVFSLLPRCSKVLLGPHLVSADGALLSIAGSLPMCLAARRLGVPVAVVSGMYKFGREYFAGEEWGMRDLGSPEEVLRPGEVEEGEETEVLNPYYDVVPAELVSLYITNLYVAAAILIVARCVVLMLVRI